jgi:hypothetical protein
MAWGLEARVPFLDKEFLEVSLSTRPEDKTFSKGSLEQKDKDGRPIMEKYILRKAFDIAPEGERVSYFVSGFSSRGKQSTEGLTGSLPSQIALPPRFDPLASKGAILRRGRLQLDRRSQSPRRGDHHGRAIDPGGTEVVDRYPRDQGGLLY